MQRPITSQWRDWCMLWISQTIELFSVLVHIFILEKGVFLSSSCFYYFSMSPRSAHYTQIGLFVWFRLVAVQNFSRDHVNNTVTVKSLCGNLEIWLNYHANAYFQSRNSVRGILVTDRDGKWEMLSQIRARLCSWSQLSRFRDRNLFKSRKSLSRECAYNVGTKKGYYNCLCLGNH